MRKHFSGVHTLLFSGAIGVALLFGVSQALAEVPTTGLTCTRSNAFGTCYTLQECQEICEFLGYSADRAICDQPSTCCYCRT